jgi:hypothetical protein
MFLIGIYTITFCTAGLICMLILSGHVDKLWLVLLMAIPGVLAVWLAKQHLKDM